MILKMRFIYVSYFIICFFSVYFSFLFGQNIIKIIALLSTSILLIVFLSYTRELNKLINFFNKIGYSPIVLYAFILSIFYFKIISIIKILILISFGLVVYIFYKYNFSYLLKFIYYMLFLLIIASLIVDPPVLHINPLYYFLNRYSGIFGINQTAIIGLLFGIYSLYFLKKYKSKKYIVFFLFSFFVIIITGSRTSLLTLIFSLLLFKFRINKIILYSLFIVIIILIFYANTVYDIALNILQHYQNIGFFKFVRFDMYSVKLRLEGSLLSAYEISRTNNFLPMGFNVVNDIKERYNIFIDNSYLSILIEEGILGLVIFIIFILRLIFLINLQYIFMLFPIISILFFFENIWSFSLFNILVLSLIGIALKENSYEKTNFPN